MDDVAVQFSEEGAHAGKSAWWQTAGAALKCTNFVSALLQRATVSLWVRLETKSGYKSHIGMFSMRSSSSANTFNATFDLAYKGTINSTVMNESGIGNCFMGSPLTGIPKSKGGDISVKEWHMITVTRDEGRIRGYIDGVPCTDVTVAGDSPRGGALLAQGYMVTLGANIRNDSGFSEMMNANGRLDDVAIYSRCLTDAEVAALYAAQTRPSAADAVSVAANAALDLLGSSLATATLAGAGTVSDGTVAVSGTLAVDPAAPLTVDRIVLGANGVVDCGRTADDPLPTRGTLVVVAANAVAGDPSGWTVTGTGWPEGRVRARLAVTDDQDLALELTSGGTAIFIR
ncbi:MAG: LamG domain-containing protein [Kiritimatiellia bacterium]